MKRGACAALVFHSAATTLPSLQACADFSQGIFQLARIDAVGGHYRTNERIGQRISKCDFAWMAVHRSLSRAIAASTLHGPGPATQI